MPEKFISTSPGYTTSDFFLFGIKSLKSILMIDIYFAFNEQVMKIKT